VRKRQGGGAWLGNSHLIYVHRAQLDRGSFSHEEASGTRSNLGKFESGDPDPLEPPTSFSQVEVLPRMFE